jgi:hypothetical protein
MKSQRIVDFLRLASAGKGVGFAADGARPVLPLCRLAQSSGTRVADGVDASSGQARTSVRRGRARRSHSFVLVATDAWAWATTKTNSACQSAHDGDRLVGEVETSTTTRILYWTTCSHDSHVFTYSIPTRACSRSRICRQRSTAIRQELSKMVLWKWPQQKIVWHCSERLGRAAVLPPPPDPDERARLWTLRLHAREMPFPS